MDKSLSVAGLVGDTLLYKDLSSSVRDGYLAIERELCRRQHAASPVLWARERLSEDLSSLQRCVLTGVRDHSQTAVRHLALAETPPLAALATAWWIDSSVPGSTALACAEPGEWLDTFWRELEHLQVRGRLFGKIFANAWVISLPGRERRPVVLGCIPAGYANASVAVAARASLHVLACSERVAGAPQAKLLRLTGAVDDDIWHVVDAAPITVLPEE